MERETIALDARAQQRLYVLNHILAGELTVEQAAAYLELSDRQVRRLVDRYRAVGAAALVHGNRGRQPANRIRDAHRARLVELARTTYQGFNPVHLAEALQEDEVAELHVSARTLRRLRLTPGWRCHGPGDRRVTAAGGTGCRGRECSSKPTAAATTGSRSAVPA